MTALASRPIEGEQLDFLAAIADTVTPLGRLHMDDFRQACEAVADDDGWVNPNLVSAWLHAKWGEIDPQSYSAKWGPACGKNGFMVKTARLVATDPKFSRGNGNKDVRYRRLRSHLDLASQGDGEAGPAHADSLRAPAPSLDGGA